MVLSEAVTDQQIAQWHKDGAVVIEDFFAAEEIAPIYADYQAQYGVQGQGDGKPWTSSRQEVLVPHTENSL